jgi:hypothetical protein
MLEGRLSGSVTDAGEQAMAAAIFRWKQGIDSQLIRF